jgi:hypothetical protein
MDDSERQALDELAAAGIGEGDFEGDEAGVPTDLVELYEIQEWLDAGGPAGEGG